GSRAIRQMFRVAAQDFISIGIPPSRLGIMLGFQTTPGSGGREHLQPASKWFELTKLQALAARTVAREVGLATVWSWGWATWTPAESDSDKPTAACVYLWSRDPKLCTAPRLAGPALNTDLTAGQLLFPPRSRCTARGVIADELRRARIQARLRVGGPSTGEIRSYYDTYAAAPVRLVQVKPAAPWLANSARGFALGAVAPPQVFTLKLGRQATLRTM